MTDYNDEELSRALLTYTEALRRAKEIEEASLRKLETPPNQKNTFEDPLDHQKSKPPK